MVGTGESLLRALVLATGKEVAWVIRDDVTDEVVVPENRGPAGLGCRRPVTAGRALLGRLTLDFERAGLDAAAVGRRRALKARALDELERSFDALRFAAAAGAGPVRGRLTPLPNCVPSFSRRRAASRTCHCDACSARQSPPTKRDDKKQAAPLLKARRCVQCVEEALVLPSFATIEEGDGDPALLEGGSVAREPHRLFQSFSSALPLYSVKPNPGYLLSRRPARSAGPSKPKLTTRPVPHPVSLFKLALSGSSS
ncbi:hypothetical protein DIPPA_03485 [Diplonema papillatum]|nr:hypothetical protein DIPPA_03485 [Diplonema papillatum]